MKIIHNLIQQNRQKYYLHIKLIVIEIVDLIIIAILEGILHLYTNNLCVYIIEHNLYKAMWERRVANRVPYRVNCLSRLYFRYEQSEK